MTEQEYIKQNPHRHRYGSDWHWYAKQARNKAFSLKHDTPMLLAYWDKANPAKADDWRQKDKQYDFANLPNSRDWWQLTDDEIHEFSMLVKQIRENVTLDDMIQAKQQYYDSIETN